MASSNKTLKPKKNPSLPPIQKMVSDFEVDKSKYVSLGPQKLYLPKKLVQTNLTLD